MSSSDAHVDCCTNSDISNEQKLSALRHSITLLAPTDDPDVEHIRGVLEGIRADCTGRSAQQKYIAVVDSPLPRYRQIRLPCKGKESKSSIHHNIANVQARLASPQQVDERLHFPDNRTTSSDVAPSLELGPLRK